MAKKTKEKTDYVLLAIVAAVAMVSIVAMYNAKDSTTLTPQPTLAGNVAAQTGMAEDSSPSLTGNAVSYPSPTSSYGTPAANTRDFDGDGKVDLNDVLILYDYFYDGRCPAGVTCDLNKDGRLTEEDAKALERSVRSARNVVGQATAFMEDNFDYDNSGRVTLRDKDLLRFYQETDACPAHRDCDVDNDGHLTYRDVTSMNIYIKLDEANTRSGTVQESTYTAPARRNLVGQATIEREEDFDYNNDGAVTLADKNLLQEYLDEDSCPISRNCDVDDDGHFTYRDVSSMNIYIKLYELNSQQRTPQTSSEPAVTKTVFRAAGLA